ncbi:MAG: cysteine desulfurase NifS, cysteine desulfurase [Candidatus Nomurabacteria bacterium]|nr:cysteine desulfurase NifS, cysteine desulfurase [Candidatus Nomurabacteria bacterium]
MNFFKQRCYLDYASSTPVDARMIASFPRLSPAVLQANPSALHKEGRLVKVALENARQLVAETLFARADEIIFTANATESDNIALQGAVTALLKKNSEARIAIVTTDSEHAAVLETVKALTDQVHVIILPTDMGVIDPKQIEVPEDATAMIVSVMYVNNEIGTVQPIYDIAKRVRFLRKHHPDMTILLHVDATQAPLHYVLNVQKMGVDMMTLGATKLYCPKGVGMLYIKRDTLMAPILHGGGQERGLRPGTEAVQLVHFFAQSLAYAQKNVVAYTENILSLQQYFEHLIQKEIPSAIITASSQERTPHISHIAVPNFESELLVLELDARGIAVSSKSACKNEDANESELLERIYGKGWGAIRVSFGRMTTKSDLKKAVEALKKVIAKYNHIG